MFAVRCALPLQKEATLIRRSRYYAGWAGKVAGETIETSQTKLAYTLLDPIGVCGQIIPVRCSLTLRPA